MASESSIAANRKQWPSRLWLDPPWPALLLPLVLGVVQIVGSYAAGRGQTDRASLDAFGVALLAAGPAALIVRDRYPVAVLWALVGVTLVYLLSNYPYGPFIFSIIVALYITVKSGHRVAAWLGGALLYGGHFALRYLIDGDTPMPGQMIGVAAWLLVVLAASEVVRARHESV